MTSPLLNRKSLIAVAQEATPGTAETLDAGDAALVVYDLACPPDIPMTERKAPGRPGRISSVVGAYSGRVTFKTDLYGGGVAVPVPAIADLLLPACGFIKTSSTFARSLLPPEADGAATKTVTIGVYKDGKFRKLHGAMGTVKFLFPAGQKAYAEWSFLGVWNAVTDAAMLSATYPAYTPLRASAGSLTLTYGSDAWTPRAQELSLDLGNQLHLLPDVLKASGFHCCCIPDYQMGGSINPLSTLVADHDLFGHLLAGHEMALAYTLGSVAGYRITFSAPALQFSSVQEGDRDGVEIDSIDFQLNTLAAAGADELTILFS